MLFTDKSTGSPNSWSWNFGDETTSTNQSPTHTYVEAGNYTVTLTVTNNAGSNMISKDSYVLTTTDEQPQPTSTEQSEPSSASINLYGEKTNVTMGEDTRFTLSVVNLITKPTMHAQVIIIPPSGMSVSSSGFVESGAGQYSAKFDMEPGQGKDIEVGIVANQVGKFDVKGRVILLFRE